MSRILILLLASTGLAAPAWASGDSLNNFQDMLGSINTITDNVRSLRDNASGNAYDNQGEDQGDDSEDDPESKSQGWHGHGPHHHNNGHAYGRGHQDDDE